MSKVPLIAVVDDDQNMREALADLVEVFGYESTAFSGPESFLAAHRAQRYDCVVTDVRMPGFDGFELRRQLRRIDPPLPVIFVTSYDDDATRTRAMNAGVRAFLAKPVDADVLEEHLKAALNR